MTIHQGLHLTKESEPIPCNGYSPFRWVFLKRRSVGSEFFGEYVTETNKQTNKQDVVQGLLRKNLNDYFKNIPV